MPHLSSMSANAKLPAQPSRILVRGTNWVGDTVISLPAAKGLKRIFPSAHFTFWTPRGLKSLVEATGVADEVICFEKNERGPLTRALRMRGPLVSGKFDMVVLFQNAFESAFTAWLARVPIRVGYPTDLRGPLLTVRVPLDDDIRAKHQVFYYRGITEFLEGRFLGTGTSRDLIPDCSIELGAASLQRAQDLLASLGADERRPLFCLCPGSVNSEAKRWPRDFFSRLADLLIQRMDAQVALLGAPEEEDLIERITRGMSASGAVKLAGKADMITSMAMMSRSRLVISNDTGSAHLAVAASARVLTVFGPTSAGATAPYGPDAHIIQGDAPCAPCRHYKCPLPDHPCMRSIQPEAVLDRVKGILAE